MRANSLCSSGEVLFQESIRDRLVIYQLQRLEKIKTEMDPVCMPGSFVPGFFLSF